MKKKLFGLLLVASSFLTVGGQVTELKQTVDSPIIENEYGLVETTTDDSNKTVKLNVKNAAGFIGNDAAVDVSPTYVSSTKINGVAYLRYATAVKGAFNNISYTRTMDGVSQDVAVKQVYKGLSANGTILYYNGSEPVTDTNYAGQYFWAVYMIKFESNNSYSKKNVNISVQLNVTKEDDTVISSLAKTTSLESDLVMTAGDIFGKDYSIGFALSAYAEKEYTHAADDIYVKYTSDGTNMTFDMKGLGVFTDTEYVKIVLHNSLYDHLLWQTIGSDVTLDITKNTIYKGEGRWNFWGSEGGVYDYTNLGQNTTKLTNVPTFTQNDGWFQLTVTLPLSIMGGYSSNGQIKAFFSEWDSGVVVDNHDAPYFPRIENGAFVGCHMTIDNGVQTGDMAYQVNYITLKERTEGVDFINAHASLVSNETIRNNKVTLTQNQDNGYADIFTTRDSNGVSIRVEEYLRGGRFWDNYNEKWWLDDNLEFRFYNGKAVAAGQQKQFWFTPNIKTNQNEMNDADNSLNPNAQFDKYYVSDVMYNESTGYWNINYEAYVSYSKLGMGSNDEILIKYGSQSNTGWTCCSYWDSTNLMDNNGQLVAITENGFAVPTSIYGKTSHTSTNGYGDAFNVAGVIVDGSENFEVTVSFRNLGAGQNGDNYAFEVFSPFWANGGLTTRYDWWGWGSWNAGTGYNNEGPSGTWNGTEWNNEIAGPMVDANVLLKVAFDINTGIITANATCTANTGTYVGKSMYVTYQTRAISYRGPMYVSVGAINSTIQNISFSVTKGNLVR